MTHVAPESHYIKENERDRNDFACRGCAVTVRQEQNNASFRQKCGNGQIHQAICFRRHEDLWLASGATAPSIGSRGDSHCNVMVKIAPRSSPLRQVISPPWLWTMP